MHEERKISIYYRVRYISARIVNSFQTHIPEFGMTIPTEQKTVQARILDYA